MLNLYVARLKTKTLPLQECLLLPLLGRLLSIFHQTCPLFLQAPAHNITGKAVHNDPV